MKLPNVEQAYIEERKIVDYLLAAENSSGKTEFFASFGFTAENWERLRDALLSHAVEHVVTRMSETPHGIKYVIEGMLQTPDGRSPQVRSVWIVDKDKTAPRLVTAYPLKESAND